MKKILIVSIVLFTVLKTEAQTSVFSVVDSLLLKGNYQKALGLLENEPKNTQVFDKMADIFQDIGNYTKANEFYTKALEDEDNNIIKIKLAKVLKAQGLTDKAITLYETILQKDSTNLLVANNLGKLYLGVNQPKKAQKIYKFLKEKDPTNPNYSYQIGESLGLQNKFLKQGQSYLDAYNLDTLHFKSIYELAKFFKKLKYKDSTMLFIDKGLQIDKNSLNFNQLKANELYYLKDFNGALKYLSRLDSLNFISLNTYEMFGMCYYNLKELDSAETYFKKAIRLDRNNPKILYRMANLYYEKEDMKLAKLYLTMSIMYAKPDLDKQYFLLGTIFKEENDFKQALTNFEKAFQNNSKNFKALFEIATTSDVYYKDSKIALLHYKKYIERFENKDLQMTLYANKRIDKLKKELFIKGEIVD
ncbi:tetratricopeptide repeat protein [Lutibacter sp. B1]|uniref:tetratricopeptide repeat protein n=1 Tax=Lutibacter sp. B1 TaxID=2725996 RepID=UPI001456BD87|nr:tetratricopeptide repeat protein [Lutibacter sp. B1]NLP58024.1 tetratricopeptide repeat protein [Lutibacter sp. B1]